jgi:SAM-dependent methyltransferase
MGAAARRWSDGLARWGIPEEILAAAPETPWTYPAELFVRRAEASASEPPRASTIRAAEAMPEGGTVLDVGCGGGAASLPLAGRASRMTGVDTSAEMLEAFRRKAGAIADTVEGAWPDVADRVEPADVVVCHHVLYNVADIGPFVRALDGAAERRVVIELTARHPLWWMNDLWLRFHGLERPDDPDAGDAAAAIAEQGIDVQREDAVTEPRAGGFERQEDAVALVRRRLCLPADRDDEVADALGERLTLRDGLWTTASHQPVTALWWDIPLG